MWHYIVNNQPVGPVDDNEIQKLISEGRIRRGQMVWTQGMPGWQPIERTRLVSLFTALSPAPGVPNVTPGMPNAFPGGQYAPVRPVITNKYEITFLQAPPDNQPFQSVQPRPERYPVVIANSRAFKDGVQMNVNYDYLNRLISSLKDSQLFLDAGQNFIDFGGEKKQYHQISFTAVETWNLHMSQVIIISIIIGAASVLFIPFLALYFLIKFNKEFTQEMIVEFKAANGVTQTFRAITTGQLKYKIFGNAQAAADALGGFVCTSNINSIINQIISQRDTLGL
jgi:hypothetical protein